MQTYPPFRPMPGPNEDNAVKMQKLAGYGIGIDAGVQRDLFAWAILTELYQLRNDFEVGALGENVESFEAEFYPRICERFQIALGEFLDNALEQAPRMRLQMPGPGGNPTLN